jgi:hypothetical protein
MRRRPLVRRIANFSWRGAQQPARAGWMRGVRDHHGRVGGQGIQQFFASGDEGFRLCFVEPAGNDFRLVIFETQTMQQRNQSRPQNFFALKAPAWRVVRGNVAPTQAFGCPDGKCCPLGQTSPVHRSRLPRIAGASPGSCRVNKENLGDLLAAPAIVQENERIGPSRQPMCRRAVPRQSDQVGAVFPVTGSRRESCPKTNPKIAAWQAIFRISNELGYSNGKKLGCPVPLAHRSVPPNFQKQAEPMGGLL